MKLGEAIKRFDERQESLFLLLPPDDFNMLLLLIEAGKKLQECQEHHCTLSHIELPGETKD